MPSLLTFTIRALNERGEKALIAFITAGDPSLDALPQIVQGLQDAGVDVIEIGMPFSDPIADGPVIQESSQRALDRGVTPSMVLDAVLAARAKVPVVLMGYLNPILRMGMERFAGRCVEAGVAGTIVCDIIPEEAGAWIDECRARDLDTIFLAAPTSSPARLDAIAAVSTGFVYAVSRTGVTGTRKELVSEAPRLVADLRERTKIPICVGFGISTPDDVRAVCAYADGAIVGSALVSRLAKDSLESTLKWVRELKAATRVG